MPEETPQPAKEAPKETSKDAAKPVAADPKKKDNSLKIVLIVVVVIVALLVLGGIAMTMFVGSAFRRAAGNVKVNSDGKSGSVTVQSDDGQSKSTFGEGAQLPEGWPSDAPIFEPSTIVYATKSGEDRFSSSFKTSSAAKDVLAYYRAELKKQGWTIKSEGSYDVASTLLMTKNKRQLSVTISTHEDDDNGENTVANLTIYPEYGS